MKNRERRLYQITILVLIIFIIILIANNIAYNSGKTNTKKAINDNKVLSKKHCKDEICVEDLSITKENNICYFNGYLTNSSDKTIEDRFINFIFEKDGEKVKVWYYINSLKNEDQILLNVGLPGQEYFNSTDYKLEIPTEEEIEKYKEQVENNDMRSGF